MVQVCKGLMTSPLKVSNFLLIPQFTIVHVKTKLVLVLGAPTKLTRAMLNPSQDFSKIDNHLQ